MDRFIARENIRHFRDKLLSDVDGAVRLSVERLLLAEENKLGHDLELLADVHEHIAECDRRIEAQRARVSTMLADGHNGFVRANAFLNHMMESRRIFVRYQELLTEDVRRNPLLDR